MTEYKEERKTAENHASVTLQSETMLMPSPWHSGTVGCYTPLEVSDEGFAFQILRTLNQE
jgi:hypothetical protein